MSPCKAAPTSPLAAPRGKARRFPGRREGGRGAPDPRRGGPAGGKPAALWRAQNWRRSFAANFDGRGRTWWPARRKGPSGRAPLKAYPQPPLSGRGAPSKDGTDPLSGMTPVKKGGYPPLRCSQAMRSTRVNGSSSRHLGWLRWSSRLSEGSSGSAAQGDQRYPSPA